MGHLPGANTVRIVWAITNNLQPGGPATSMLTLDALITTRQFWPHVTSYNSAGTRGNGDRAMTSMIPCVRSWT
ncbi:MAG: hypothetical protein OIN86_10705 [Candidatus Methanoperedens sp.]|nr:hypothetical protein [Candidatus Methanoperedens sp.]